MDRVIERAFRFVEMVGITALIKAVIVPAYPLSGAFAVAILTSGATLYVVNPAWDYCIEALTKEVKTIKPILVSAFVTGALFLIIQLLWLNPLVETASDLIKDTISTNPAKAQQSK